MTPIRALSRSAGMCDCRLNLSAIESCLRDVQKEFPRINEHLKSHRDAMVDAVVANMMAGYAFVDRAIAERTDLFAMGNSRHLLELNHLVLCGNDPEKRRDLAAHFEATERHFYAEEGGGVRDIMEWYALHGSATVWKRASGVYIRVLSEPQLFIEGNHRSGALIMSYLLVRERQPPFVLTVENAKAYFDPSTLIRQTKKHSFAMLVRMPKLKRRFARFLQDQADERFLSYARPF
jgi:hypothetical protein